MSARDTAAKLGAQLSGMSPGDYVRTIRAMVEGGLRLINNMIPEAPTPRQIRQTIQPAPPAAPAAPAGQAFQRRLNVPPDKATGRFQRQLPGPREVPAEQIPKRAGYPQADVPREALPTRVPGVAPGQRSLPVGRTPAPTVPTRPLPIRSSPQAPEPAFAYGKELMRRDPEGYGRIRSIVETTAAERGVDPDAVMEALLGPEGFDSSLIRQLEAAPTQYLDRGGALTRSAGGGMAPPAQGAGLAAGGRGGALTRTPGSAIEPGIEQVNVYEILGRGLALPEGLPITARANAMGGVNTVDLGQLISSPEVAQAAAVGGSAAARRIPLGPFVGAGALGGLGLAAYMQDRQPGMQQAVDAFGRAPGETQLGVPTATPEAGANTPSVTGAPLTAPAQPIAGGTNAIPGTVNPSTPGAAAPAVPVLPSPAGGQAPVTPVGSSIGAGSVPQLMDSGVSEYSQAVQNAAQGLRQDASQYKNIGDLYRVQAAYANAPGRAEEIIGALRGMGAPASVGIESEANFEAWARSKPELAYRLQLQMQRRGPSQQMPQQQGVVLGTPMGTHNAKNAVGESQAAALSAAYGGQGPSELKNALAPQAYQITQRMPLF